MGSNKEIFVKAFCVIAIFLAGYAYAINIQEDRSVVSDLRATITDLQIENFRLKTDNITVRSILLVQYTMNALDCSKRAEVLEKDLPNK